jgi:hypothetical protein
MKRTAFFVVVIFFLVSTIASTVPDAIDESSPGAEFVEGIWKQLEIEEISCRTLSDLPSDSARCGRLPDGAVYATVHGLAFRLAGEGVPVLSLETFSVPPYQLVDLPGFEPFEDVPGFHVLGYLIGMHRIGVWTRGDLIVLSVEELDEPFPLNMPAVERQD